MQEEHLNMAGFYHCEFPAVLTRWQSKLDLCIPFGGHSGKDYKTQPRGPQLLLLTHKPGPVITHKLSLDLHSSFNYCHQLQSSININFHHLATESANYSLLPCSPAKFNE